VLITTCASVVIAVPPEAIFVNVTVALPVPVPAVRT
jgi:hypothetical protein